MVVNFIDATTLNWILIREEKTTVGGFRGTSYTDPHVILKRLEVLEKGSRDPSENEVKRYSPGIYRATKGGLAERSKALGC